MPAEKRAKEQELKHKQAFLGPGIHIFSKFTRAL